jgi:tRNA modification GTPase
MEDDTIVAISTPPGRAALGIVRLSGAESIAIGRQLSGHDQLMDRRATTTWVVDRLGSVIDETVMTAFCGPHSFTGEDVVEITCHGSPFVLDHLVAATLALGARHARPGEFTLRAFLNGRLDLTQAEAVLDIVEARTSGGVGLAVAQLEGELSRRLQPIRSGLMDLLAHMTAVVEFAEDDVDPLVRDEMRGSLEDNRAKTQALLAATRQGAVLQHGISLAIVGAPNVGKSSILNRLLGRERAIVTAIAGTTRDTIEAELVLGEVRFNVVDTAGITETEDPVETIGIERSRSAIKYADMVLLVVDASRPWGARDERVLQILEPNEDLNARSRDIVVALNKTDLGHQVDESDLAHRLPIAHFVHTAAVPPDRLEELRKALPRVALGGPAPEGFVVSNQRHIQALAEANEAITHAIRANDEETPLDLVSLDVRQAVAAVDSIVGVNSSDDVLDRIFSRFCIGK